MRFKIDKCEVYGLRRPFIQLDGWVESKAIRLEIKAGDQVIFSKPFEHTKSKIHVFNIRTALDVQTISTICKIEVVQENEQRDCLLEFKTTPKTRLLQKFNYQKHEAYDESDPAYKKPKKIVQETAAIQDEKEYQYWIKHHETFHDIEDYEYQPLISIVMPVYNVDREYLSKCINSILHQTYQNFEICIADDCSPNEDTKQTLRDYQALDPRVKVLFREKNGHISEATNSALTLAQGEFVGLMDNDDALMPQALNEVVRVLNQRKDIDFIYTDEDKVDMKGNRSDPQFKPDYTIDKLYGGNYICHFSVIRRSIVEQIGGFRKGYEGAQDFDLFLRVSEVTDKFYHIPKVLYHWRMIPGSTALSSDSKNYAGEAGKKALQDYFDKRKEDVQLDIVIHTHYNVEYLPAVEEEIEIIVHVQSLQEKLLNCLSYTFANLSYENVKVHLFTTEPEELKTFLSDQFDFKKLFIHPITTSFVESINDYVKETKSKYLLFMDEFSKIETFNALEQLLGYAEKEKFGAVGCKIMNQYHTVVDTGYYVTGNNLIPLYYSTYANDYGIYGTLLVPNCFRVIEDSFFMVKTSVIKELGYFDSSLSKREAYFDAFMRMHQAGYRNILLPKVEIMVNRMNVRDDVDFETLIAKWQEAGIDVTHDCFYNENVSSRMSYRFEKSGGSNEHKK